MNNNNEDIFHGTIAGKPVQEGYTVRVSFTGIMARGGNLKNKRGRTILGPTELSLADHCDVILPRIYNEKLYKTPYGSTVYIGINDENGRQGIRDIVNPSGRVLWIDTDTFPVGLQEMTLVPKNDDE